MHSSFGRAAGREARSVRARGLCGSALRPVRSRAELAARGTGNKSEEHERRKGYFVTLSLKRTFRRIAGLCRSCSAECSESAEHARRSFGASVAFGLLRTRETMTQHQHMNKNDSHRHPTIGEVRPNLPLVLGHLRRTRQAKSLNVIDVSFAIAAHRLGNWGHVCVEDHDGNNRALVTGGTVRSIYFTRDGTEFWIVTEADRSATTVLLPAEM